MNEETLRKKILPVLKYIGLIGSILMSIAYIICVMVMIKGFQYHQTTQTIVFSLVNAVVGLVICNFLRYQGVALAMEDPEAKAIAKEYYFKPTKDKKFRSIRYFWVTNIIKDIFTKGVTVAFTTAALIYIVIEGSNDYSMLYMAVVNLLMFICFGIMAMDGAYNFYLNNHVPYMKEQIRIKGESKECSRSGTKNSET